MVKENKITVKDLAKLTGRSKSAIYNLCKKLGRLPTVEEIKNQKRGRPTKY